ncbi:MAG: cell surface protein SprA [Ekhidna sp.]|uniref:T9SS outer membrane translocon Sov/SprA n=1 Tax=Ekhidna sp. TaxID=2608089 RepID=UPI0032EB4FA1
MRENLYIRLLFACLLIGCGSVAKASLFQEQDTVQTDTVGPYEPSKKPTFQPGYRFGDPFSFRSSRSPLFLRDPSQLDMQVQFNPDTTAEDAGVTYSVYENIGALDFRPASFMTFGEFNRYNNSQLNREYFKERSVGLDGESAVSGRSLIPRLYISPVFDRIFGGSYVDIQPNGFVNLDFGARFQRIDNPAIPLRQQKNGAFNFDQQISMNVVGKVGEKLAITANFDNNNTFDFQNNLKVEYTGYEEEIIQKIEIGNVSMPVTNSLMSGAQSLFGIKTELQFGKLYVTTILSQQRGRNETLTIESGFQGREFEIQASDYDENRHFFLGHFFRDNYEQWLSALPQVISGVNVTRAEVYVLNRNNDTQTTRNIVGFMDLGEGEVIHRPALFGNGNGGPTRNNANTLFNSLPEPNSPAIESFLSSLDNPAGSFENSTDYVKVTTARKLDESEYKINRELGYITLTRSLASDEILAVAYEYTYNGTGYKVGELTEDYQNRSDDKFIYLKLLRPNKINTQVPTWDLMMKNIYNLNAAQVSQEGFQLRVIYRDDNTGQDNPSLHEGRRLKDRPLVEVFNLDRLNPTGDRQPDGNFDFIEGYTIDVQNGNIIFPILEPFGENLESQFDSDEGRLVEKYVYDELYDEPKATAELNATQNKFVISGRLTAGSSSEITLPGINIAEGSVTVIAGSTPLTEGLDYTVDYNLGRVRILNEGILNSGKQIQISYEKADLFNFQTRTLTGARFDYRFNDNFNIGATVLHLNERPGGISRYAVGNEPTKNTKYGFDINYQNESRFLTKMVDKIPLISTKAPSTVTINAEFAQLIPGTSNVVDGEGTSYIDDFENAITPINIMGWQAWKLAATPRVFSEAQGGNSNLSFNDRKAKIAWYTVDNSIFYRAGGNARPSNISDSDLENHYERLVLPQEIFRQRDQTLVNFNEPIFDVAFFPSERGQYNYNPATSADNTLPNPEQNWGGVTRAITNEVNFNKTNIEYLEFWLMDPFINGERGVVKDGRFNENASLDQNGGKLIFNLGSVSEDIAPDDKHAFENGLPANGDIGPITTWGQITEEQYLTNFFENSPGARDNQDVGIDGLSDDDEGRILNGTGINLNPTDGDISADNFRYILDGEYDAQNAKIVQRYKNWNGMENNSPIAGGGGQFIPASTTLPDNEDLNQDNTVSDLEEYFEYEIDLAPKNQSTNPDGGNLVLQEYIVDQIESGNGESNWYLFRIPIKNVGRPIGNPTFENIKYVRMYLTGWSQPVVLRFAQMRLVGSQWRKYDRALNEPGLDAIPNIETSDFSVSVVNIEDNSTSTTGGVRYVLPPGINRDIDNTTTQNRRINEQSLQVCVEDLDDKDARAVYKNVSYDLINYGRMKMFFHAEAYNNEMVLDDEVTAFLRLGTDFDENYYEVEVPLKVTPQDITGNLEEIRRQVWPLENEIDISIKELLGIKSERNRANLDENIPYSVPSNDGKYTFTVKGRPDISAVQVMMIGVKNPGDESSSAKSVCVWANELRVTDFDSNAGWAANARISTKLADLGTVSASTRYTSIGFGNIQQRISERTRAETKQYDISANLNLEKFMRPDKTGLVVPMFVSYEKTTITPQFDPLDPDVPLEASLESIDDAEERARYRRIVEDRTTRRSINFTNVRKEKVNPDAKSRIYDIENFAFSYAYSDRVSSNVNTETLFNKTVSGGVNYNFSPAAWSIEPFGESEKLTSPYLALIKDINFSPVPTNFSVSTNLRRDFRLTQYYNNDLTTEGVDPLYERTFTFARNYGMRWDITKSLGLTYSATANAVIDEPEGIIEGDINTRNEREYIWDQIFNLGRMKNFNQSIAANYSLPLDKIPFTDWLSSDVRYSVGYGWVAGAINRTASDTVGLVDDDLFFGNFINNQRTIGLTGRIDMNKVYDKVTFLKNANTPPGRGESVSPGNKALRFMMMLKSINGSYNINEGTSLPGFKPTAFLFGLDSGFSAPGLGFIFGSQDSGIKQKAARNGWLVRNENLTSPFQQTYGTDIDIQADLEPAKDLRVQLSWNRGLNNQYQEIFRFDGNGGFETLTPSRSGSYSISFLSIKTAFQKDGPDNSSEAFSEFERNIDIIRRRQNENNPVTANSSLGYDSISQDVLIPAFLAAYSGKDASDVSLSPFPKVPLPNWRVDYAGLVNIPAISEVFSSFTISHGYNSTYSVSSFTNSLNYGEDLIGLQNDILDYPLARDDSTGRLVPVYIINQVMVSEQFVPLIGFNIRTKSNISTRLEFRKSRSLALNMSNAQVTETTNNDVTLDLGYSKVGFKLPWRWQGRTMTLKNDLTMRVAASVRDSKTVQRKINERSTITNGNLTWQVRPTITYKINNQLDFTFYMERNVTDPKVLSSYKRATTAFGVQLRFGLSQ